MEEFRHLFELNLDCIILVESCLLLIAAIGAAALARIEFKTAWNWLAGAALTWVSASWISLTLVDLSHSALVSHIALAAEAIGSLLLIEFSGRTTRLFDRRWTRALYVVWLGAIAFAFWRYGLIG